MTFQPDHFFALEALVPGEGWCEPSTLFIRERDGRYRVASGEDIAAVRENFPSFFRQTMDEAYCEECGAKQIGRNR